MRRRPKFWNSFKNTRTREIGILYVYSVQIKLKNEWNEWFLENGGTGVKFQATNYIRRDDTTRLLQPSYPRKYPRGTREEAGHGWQRRRGRLSARLVNNFLRLNASNAINSRFVLSFLYQLSECLQKRQEKQVALLLARKTFRWGGFFLRRQISLVAPRSSWRGSSYPIPQNKEKPD